MKKMAATIQLQNCLTETAKEFFNVWSYAGSSNKLYIYFKTVSRVSYTT